MRLQLAYDGAEREYSVTLLLSGVKQLVVPEMTPLLFLSELEIEDVRASMLEGIRFEVVSDDDGSFRCACAQIEILPLQPHA